jgi:dienelactone hydrolase
VRSLAAALRAESFFAVPVDLSQHLHTRHLRLDVGLAARRAVQAVDQILRACRSPDVRLALCGFGTGAAAALIAAAHLSEAIAAVVCHDGRPDLAVDALPRVRAATMLVVGGADRVLVDRNREAFDHLKADAKLVVIPGATTVAQRELISDITRRWLVERLSPPRVESSAHASL